MKITIIIGCIAYILANWILYGIYVKEPELIGLVIGTFIIFSITLVFIVWTTHKEEKDNGKICIL